MRNSHAGRSGALRGAVADDGTELDQTLAKDRQRDLFRSGLALALLLRPLAALGLVRGNHPPRRRLLRRTSLLLRHGFHTVFL